MNLFKIAGLSALLLSSVNAIASPVAFQKIMYNSRGIELHNAASTADGGYVGVGFVSASGGPDRAYMVRIDSLGAIKWTLAYADSSNAFWQSVAQTSEQSFIVTGGKLIAKISASGSVIWSKTVRTFQQGAATMEHNGGYVFAGNAFGQNNQGIALLKTDTSGKLLWSHFYEVNGGMSVNSICSTADGGMLLTGAFNSGNSTDILLMRTDANGTISWIKEFASDYNSEESGAACVETPGGGYLIAGRIVIDNLFNTHSFLLKTDATGSIIWAKEYGLSDSDLPFGLALADSGRCLIAGQTIRSGFSTSNAMLLITNDTGAIQLASLYGDANGSALYACSKAKNGGVHLAGVATYLGASQVRGAYILKTDTAGKVPCLQSDTMTSAKVLALQSVMTLTPTDNMANVLSARSLAVAVEGTAASLCSTTGITTTLPQIAAAIAPNPARSVVTISVQSTHIIELKLSDVVGNSFNCKYRVESNKAILDVSGLPDGIYYYTIVTEHGLHTSGKLTVVH